MRERNKERTAVWLYPESFEKIDDLVSKGISKNRSEFIEQAINFYTGYIQKEDNIEYISKILIGAITGTIRETENRTSANIFRLAVEMSMMMNLLAWNLGICDEDLQKLRARCSNEVKKSKGKVSFENALAYQRGTVDDKGND